MKRHSDGRLKGGSSQDDVSTHRHGFQCEKMLVGSNNCDVGIIRWIIHQDEVDISSDDRISPQIDTAILDCILRSFCLAVDGLKDKRMRDLFHLHRPGQCIIPRSSITFTDHDLSGQDRGKYICIRFASSLPKSSKEGFMHHHAREESKAVPSSIAVDLGCLIPLYVQKEITQKTLHLSRQALATAITGMRNRQALREFLKQKKAIGFVANGSILPRESGNSDKPLDVASNHGAVPFLSPPSFEVTFLLPLASRDGDSMESSASGEGSGKEIKGMLIKEGVTVIAGGGFQGKTTLLMALATGHLDRVDGDGREWVVTTDALSTLRAEDGRNVSSLDISAFISDLPLASGLDAENFSTTNASGSTSQASAVIEGLEVGVQGFLVDEDTSAVNFMIRDSRMRSLIDRETITPFIYRVNHLYTDKGVSSVVVVGGSGDWLDVQTHTLLIENYKCEDATVRARRISKAFCNGHIQYNGQGLVHQLPWPGVVTTSAVPSIRDVEIRKGVKVRFIDFTLLKVCHDGKFQVSSDGKTIHVYTTPQPGDTTCDEGNVILDLSRIDESAASGERYCVALGIAAALCHLSWLLISHSCDGVCEKDDASADPDPIKEGNAEILPTFLDDDKMNILTSTTRSERKWLRLEALLDLYEQKVCTHTFWRMLPHFHESVRLALSLGFVWPTRLLLAKVLNRFPGIRFAITKPYMQ